MEEKKQEFVPADEAVRQYEALIEGLDPTVFNADETAALLTVRMRYENDPKAVRTKRRVEFVQWLVERDFMGEGLPENGVNYIESYEPQLTVSEGVIKVHANYVAPRPEDLE